MSLRRKKKRLPSCTHALVKTLNFDQFTLELSAKVRQPGRQWQQKCHSVNRLGTNLKAMVFKIRKTMKYSKNLEFGTVD